jgi:hypothetical protein
MGIRIKQGSPYQQTLVSMLHKRDAHTKGNMNMRGSALCLFTAGLLLVASNGASAQAISTPLPTQAPLVQGSCCTWTSTGKKNQDDVASFPSSTQAEHMEIYFFKHEFGSIMVRIPASVRIKDHSRDPFKQLRKNKIQVTLTFDNAIPDTQNWGVVEYPKDATLPALTPEDRSAKLYQTILQSKQLTVSYLDADGKTVTAVFDLSGMKLQMDAHNEKVHHFGFKDGVELLGAVAPL